jgi:hypothetical protein
MKKRFCRNKQEAIQMAIDWQNWQCTNIMTYGEALEWQNYFEKLGKKFNLTKEFKENAII